MRKEHVFIIPALLLMAATLMACGNRGNSYAGTGADDAEEDDMASDVSVPRFNADSAYLYVKAQTDFGPRVPNTVAHRECGDYLAGKLREFGATVYSQEADLVAYDNTILKARNIIGAYNPEKKRRVMLCAHWDSRPYSDEENDPTLQQTPISGANDGASGVGVLLEVARQLQQQAPDVGIDIIFFDAEDYGMPSFYKGAYKHDTWCLGSQYWGRVPHVQGYNARFGILLDMVGGKGATFYREPYSQQTAGRYVRKIWNAAHRIGYGSFFPKEDGAAVTDDHVYVHTLAKIPCVDIINYDPSASSSFGDFWHKQADNMDIIDKATLNAVGQTVMEVIYKEK